MDTRESGRGLEGVLLDIRPDMRSWIAFAFDSRSESEEGGSTEISGPFRETDRLETVVSDGEGGGGIATALGILARGVLLKEGRDFDEVVEVGIPIPIPDGRDTPNAFGVLNGDAGVLRVGEASCREGCTGEPNPVDLEGLAEPAGRAGLCGVRESCFAVIPTYFAARDPGVILVGTLMLHAGVTSVRVVAAADSRGRAEGVWRLGVFRPVEAAGVTRPLLIDGVTLPLPIQGVTRPFEIDGVLRPVLKPEGVILPRNSHGHPSSRCCHPRTAYHRNMTRSETDKPGLPTIQHETHSPSNAAVVLSLPGEPATELDASPHPRLSVDLAEVPEHALKPERFDPDIVSYVERPSTSAYAPREHVR